MTAVTYRCVVGGGTDPDLQWFSARSDLGRELLLWLVALPDVVRTGVVRRSTEVPGEVLYGVDVVVDRHVQAIASPIGAIMVSSPDTVKRSRKLIKR